MIQYKCKIMMDVNIGLFDKFKKKTYLKRTDFINFADSNKICSKQ